MKRLATVGCLAAAVAALWCSGCKTSPQSPSAQPAPKVAIDDVDRVEAHARYAAGISHELNDQHEEAIEQFYLAAIADPGNEPIVIEVARRFIQRGDNDKAVELLLRSARRPSSSGEIHNWLSRAYLVQGNLSLAVAAGQAAIKKSPDSLAGYQNLAEAHLQGGQPKRALKALDQAAQFKDADAVFLVNLGGLYANYMRHHPDEEEAVKLKVIQSFDRAKALNPSNPNLLHKLADSFLSMGETAKAAEIYLGLIDEFSESSLLRAMMREKLANLFLQSSDKEQAREQLESIVRENPRSFPQAYYALGSLAYDQQDFAKAVVHFQTALLVDPDFEAAYYDLAGVHLNLRDPEEAVKALDRARARFPKSFVGEFLSGLAQSQLKDYRAAIRHFTDAEVIARTSAPERLDHLFYFQTGAAFERNHDYEMAARYFEKSIEMSPDFAEALNYLGYMWADIGINLGRAKALIARALELDPGNAAYLDSMGWALFRLDEPEQALVYLEQAAAAIETPDPIIYDHLGDVYQALGRTEDAREIWKKSLAIEASEDIQGKIDSLETVSTP